jgi:hypothetical protein
MNQLRDENAQLHGHTVELRGQVARLEERLRREGITVDDKDGKDGKDRAEVEVEEAPTGAVSVRQQGTLDADRTDAPPATEDVSRLSGFGHISGKKNSLDRKASRPTQSQTGARDKESDEGSVDL